MITKTHNKTLCEQMIGSVSLTKELLLKKQKMLFLSTCVYQSGGC